MLAPHARSQGPSPAPYPQDKLLNELIATHPYGIPGAMACTDDGHWLLVAEGGSVTFIEKGAGSGDPFADPVKRVPIGKHAPIPVEMLLDPDAVLHPLDPEGNHQAPSNAYLFIAGGRSGVWVMSADPRPGQSNQASRVDNRSGNVPVSQDNRLWCSDLDILTVGAKRYLLALFSGLDVNRLRIYDLDEVRATLDVQETGNEIAPAWNIVLRRPPGEWVPMVQDKDFGLHKAFGFAITVDGHDVYAALGSHGLIRVRLTVDEITGTISNFARSAGPVLGNSSPLYNSGPSPPISRWGDYEYRDEGNPGEYSELRRRHGPLFTDAKVLRREGVHKLFAAVDHLGWMRFDLSGTWDDLLAPEHEEGVSYALIPGYSNPPLPPIFQSSLVEDTPPRPTFARQLAIVDTGSRVVMAVAAGRDSMIVEPMWRTEGWMLDYLTHKSHIGHFFSGPDDLTLVYENPHEGYVNLRTNSLGWGRYGGERVLLPRHEQLGGTGAKVPVFGGHVVHSPPSSLLPSPTTPLLDERQATFYAQITGPAQRDAFKARFAEHRPGCYPHIAAYSILDGDILHTGGNDAGIPTDGVRYTCGAAIHNHYDPPSSSPYDSTGAFGVIMNHGAQWATSSTQTLVAGHDVDHSILPPLDNMRWSLTQFDIGANLCGPGSPTWPTAPKRIYFDKELDDLDTEPRHYYGVGQALGLHSDLLLWTQIRTHEGMIVLDRAKLEAAFQTTVADERISYEDLPNDQGSAVIRKFHTHPQFSGILTTEPTNKHAAEQMGVVGDLVTFAPRPFQLIKAGANPELRTLVAIPANSVRHETGTWPTAWNPPSDHDALKDHGMLRILDVTNKAVFASTTTPPFEHTIYSPNSPASWVDAAVFKYSTSGRTFCFVGGLQGGLFTYELTDLFNPLGGTVTKDQNFFEEYQPPKSITDEIECNIHGIVLDHVEWYDSQQVLEREELYVYVSVRRVGIMVLRFDPSKPKGSRFVVVDRIATPGWVGMPIIRPGPNGVRHLIVPDGYAGLRIYGYNG